MGDRFNRSRQVQKRQDAQSPSIFDASAYGASTGFEETDVSTFKTPFLKILQQLSPEVSKGDPQFIKEAEVGLFCNSATKEMYEELNVICLKISHDLVIWKPNRGGFVSAYPHSAENEIVARREGVKRWDSEGNEVVPTLSFYFMNADDPADIFVFPVSMASFKHGQSFATKLRLLKHQGKAVNLTWAGIWNIKTVEEVNDKGRWYSIGSTPSFIEFVDQEMIEGLILPALEMLKTAQTDYSAMESTQGQSQSSKRTDEVEY